MDQVTGSTVMAPAALALTAAEVRGLAMRPFPEVGIGVSHAVLWQSGNSMSGVMHIDAGGHLEAHVHRQAHHHFWILSGTCQVAGKLLGPGSYVHIPGGVEHGVDGVGIDGCTFVYLYLQS